MADQPRPRLTLLGGFGAEAAGTPVPDSARRLRKAKELVKLLALADGHRLHREQDEYDPRNVFRLNQNIAPSA
jgi:hypothetical protein